MLIWWEVVMIVLMTKPIASASSVDEPTNHRRGLRTLLLKKGKNDATDIQQKKSSKTTISDVYDTCQLQRPVARNVKPTWLASYPESGSEETWQIIEAMTGIVVDEEYANHGHAERGEAVVVKTHYPSHDATQAFTHWRKTLDISHAILIIRNPIYAIPAHAKYSYDHEQPLANVSSRHYDYSTSAKAKNSASSSTYIPIAYWIQWRNGKFESEFYKWMEQIEWWIETFYAKFGPDKLHLIVYEHLVSPTTGLDEMWKLGVFLQHVDPVTAKAMIPVQQFECVWNNIVKGPQRAKIEGHHDHNHNVDSKTTATTTNEKEHHDGMIRTNIFTSTQLQTVVRGIKELRDRYTKSYPELASLLNGYLLEASALQSSIAEKVGV